MTTIETTELRGRMSGPVVTPDDAAYDEARAIYNAMIDRRPALIARCGSVADVRAALEAGQRGGLPIAVRGGGHNGPGFGTVDGGLVIGEDLRVPLQGTPADLAAAVGVEAGAPADLYSEHAELGPADELAVDSTAVALLLDWFTRGDRALRKFALAESPILWPEHFDVGIALDEVNYGLSPGDSGRPLPYAYVGPWAPAGRCVLECAVRCRPCGGPAERCRCGGGVLR
jgi:hypothetical protein